MAGKLELSGNFSQPVKFEKKMVVTEVSTLEKGVSIGEGVVNSTGIAMGTDSTASGQYSHAEGNNVTASGERSIAIGKNSSSSAIDAVAIGVDINATHPNSLVWSGVENTDKNVSKGEGTFSLYPKGGVDGVYIGGTSLPQVITDCSINNLQTSNNTFTGTNAFNNTVTLSGTTNINGGVNIANTSTVNVGGSTELKGAITISQDHPSINVKNTYWDVSNTPTVDIEMVNTTVMDKTGSTLVKDSVNFGTDKTLSCTKTFHKNDAEEPFEIISSSIDTNNKIQHKIGGDVDVSGNINSTNISSDTLKIGTIHNNNNDDDDDDDNATNSVINVNTPLQINRVSKIATPEKNADAQSIVNIKWCNDNINSSIDTLKSLLFVDYFNAEQISGDELCTDGVRDDCMLIISQKLRIGGASPSNSGIDVDIELNDGKMTIYEDWGSDVTSGNQGYCSVNLQLYLKKSTKLKIYKIFEGDKTHYDSRLIKNYKGYYIPINL